MCVVLSYFFKSVNYCYYNRIATKTVFICSVLLSYLKIIIIINLFFFVFNSIFWLIYSYCALQVILASLEEGVREGRLLLQEWLVILTAQYNDAYKLIQYSNGSSIRSQLDVAFSQCPQLQPLPRLIFALLRNPLLRFHEEGVHPDYRIYLQCLFR
jgi:hypothetical protein